MAAWELAGDNVSFDILQDLNAMAAAQKEYAETQSGPLATFMSMQGFFPYKVIRSTVYLDSPSADLRVALR